MKTVDVYINNSDGDELHYKCSVAITDEEAVTAFEYLSKTEGIIPAIESAHAVAAAMKIAPEMGKDKIIVINLSGRGDKDVYSVARYRGHDIKNS